ncbi:hypothetical protein GLW03_01405 [Halobacillus halophilus]|uniref:hypothetical protein n=1 Tax=Halobacillus halophilus TaxID=1570 RepID=UPI0013721916|nr:hypothetical protein [Halobacillus halophilus]MYL28464.1 hypothetical protein [Halobacillus halophilus]
MCWQVNMVTGVYIEETNPFDVQQIKHFQTNSLLSLEQLTHLHKYLEKHNDDTSHITIKDQMLVPLSRMDVQMILEVF